MASGRGTLAVVRAAEESAEALLQVGDIARTVGKTVRAIHHYEELGLLRPHARSKGRYRLYDETAVTRVRWIGKLHDLGMSLGQIQQLLSAWEGSPSAPRAMSEIRSVFAQKLAETRAQIAHLAALEGELEASIRYLDTCERCEPAELILACSECSRHVAEETQPELIAGIHGKANGHGRCRPAAFGAASCDDLGTHRAEGAAEARRS